MRLDEGLDPETLGNGIGERLRRFREEHGLSQGDVAERTGITRESICRYEQGTTMPTVRCVCVLARFMDVTVDWLLFGEDAPGLVLRDRMLLECFIAAQDLPPEDRRTALDLLHALIANAKDSRREKMG